MHINFIKIAFRDANFTNLTPRDQLIKSYSIYYGYRVEIAKVPNYLKLFNCVLVNFSYGIRITNYF